MAQFTYSTVPGKIPALLAKIREVGVPSTKVTRDWLRSIGFRSSNDPSLISVLRQIGFLDNSGLPTEVWKQYRGANYKSVLGQAIPTGYAELYATYPDAHNRSGQELESFFSTHTSAGKQAVEKMVSTFKTLCQNADFGAAEAGVLAQPVARTSVVREPQGSAGVTININVELTLPETTDETVYDNFFKAMKKHLIAESDHD
jgi:hypothetical protein